MTDLTVDADQVDKLAAEFVTDLRDFLRPLRSAGVPNGWRQAASELCARMDQEQYLAWCWSRRQVILAAELSGEADRQFRRESREHAAGIITEENTTPAIAELGRRAGVRRGRVEAEAARLVGRISQIYLVPGKEPLPVGRMTRIDLNAVADHLGSQAWDLLRKRRFLKRLASGLPDDTTTVADVYSAEQVESMWETLVALAS